MRAVARLALAMALSALAGCAPDFWGEAPLAPVTYGQQTERQIERALQRYSALIVAMDADEIASMYAPDGVWERASGPLRGRSAIRDALHTTSNVRVLSNEMKTAAFSYNGPAVVQTGEFKQSTRLADGKVVTATGKFEATWVHSADGPWWLRRMVTRPQK